MESLPTTDAGGAVGAAALKPRTDSPVVPEGGRRRHRRRMLIVKDVQLRLLAYQAMAYLLCVGALAALVFAPSVAGLSSGDEQNLDVYASQMITLHATFWPAAFAGFIFQAVFSVYISHRIAGPLYRLRASMGAVANGEIIAPVRLRSNDFLMQDADAFNAMLDGVRRRIERIQQKRRALSATIHALDGQRPDDERSWSERLALLAAQERELEDELAGFRLAPGGGVGDGNSA